MFLASDRWLFNHDQTEIEYILRRREKERVREKKENYKQSKGVFRKVLFLRVYLLHLFIVRLNYRALIGGVHKTESKMATKEDLDMENVDRIDTMYRALLDHLLMPPAKIEELMHSQTVEKKKQMLKMHAELFEPGASLWGEKDHMLLTNILKSKVPDLQSLSRLRVVLSSANKEFMTSFLDNGGVTVLLKTIDSRINKLPMSELDVAVLYEILSCCKAVMNNQVRKLIIGYR